MSITFLLSLQILPVYGILLCNTINWYISIYIIAKPVRMATILRKEATS